jgi:VWFA-related protein
MSQRVYVLISSWVLACSAAALVAAQGQADRADRQSYSTATTAILVDVVVRDSRNRPVTDLDAGDFSISEDGTPQKIDTFIRVTRGGGIGLDVRWKAPGTTAVITPPGSGPEETPLPEDDPANQSATALVFDHMSDESLRLAQRATLDYIPMNGESVTDVAVFSMSPNLRLVQPYTKDRTKVRLAVERVVPGGTPSGQMTADRRKQVMDRRRDLLDQTAAMQGASVTGVGATATLGAQQGQIEAELQLLELERNMIDSFDALDRDHRGYDTSLAFVTIVRTLAEHPGRKSIVFFSDGLPASPVLAAKFDDLVSAANRANVTVYAVDAHGLRTHSASEETFHQVQELGETRIQQVTSGSSRTERPLMRDLERVEDMVRLDSRTGLARLANETGGFLVENSNNLSSAYKRIDEDNRFHYLLSYTPSNTDFDGRFRSISVKVSRPGVDVFSRKGYRALRAGHMSDMNTYETPAIELLDRTPLPNAFAVQAAGFTFPDPARPGLSPVVVHFATDALKFNLDAARSTYSAQAIVVVRVRDGGGAVVQKLSQQYILSGDMKEVDAARRGDILFYREPELKPGTYNIETVVFDAVAGHGSARLSTLTVPAVQPGVLGMSSLVLVNRSEDVNETPSTDVPPPLYVGQTILYPNAGEPIVRAPDAALSFFFTLYGDTHGAMATATLLRDGKVIAESPLALPASTAERTQHVGRMPVDTLPPGIYELRISVTSDRQVLERNAFFTLRD